MSTRLPFKSRTAGRKVSLYLAAVAGGLLAALILPGAAIAHAQQSAARPSDQELQQKIAAISVALAETQQQIEQSQKQMQQLQTELEELRSLVAAPGSGSAVPSAAAPPEQSAATQEERQQTTEAALKVLDQIKVESASKYPLTLTGLILFNGFLNRGVPDNVDLPAVALHRTSTSGNGSLGGGFRQSFLGVAAQGPHLLGARTSANLYVDFFDGLAYTSYGTSAGVVRVRTAAIDFNWQNDLLEVGLAAPLISPLSPTSYATVAEPALAGAGNLWTWAPQLRYAHTLASGQNDRLQFEFGLWDPSSAGYNPNQSFRTASPGELSQQPAYESRISLASHQTQSAEIGGSGYYSRQAYPGYGGANYTEHLDSWAATADWRLPFAHYLEWSGEGYRGRAIGGLGGGVYKDVITGTNPVSGLPALQGLNAAGGWAQLKSRFTQELEANAAMGLDNGFAQDFHAVLEPSTATASQLRARNRMFMSNLIYRPKTYIILSPEYRRIWSWPINSPVNTLNVFTLSVGFEY